MSYHWGRLLFCALVSSVSFASRVDKFFSGIVSIYYLICAIAYLTLIFYFDTDHDFVIDKEDFSRYEGHTLSRKAIDRIFGQAPRKFTCATPNKMSYEDFICKPHTGFMLSEEDKTSVRALEYWFKVIDTDSNGIITAHEMEYFYEEQLHRLEYLNQEIVPFKDVLCQM